MARRLTDSEARWEAILVIAGAVEGYLAAGGLIDRGEARGWTEADVLAVEQHVLARIDGLIRRPRTITGVDP